MGSKVIGAAVATVCLAGGFMIGRAVPSGNEDAQAPVPTVEAAGVEEWLAPLALAATSQRLEGVPVMIVTVDGALPDDVKAVEEALTGAGANIVASATLEPAWWDPEQVAYRSSLGQQLAQSVAGAGEIDSADILDHALIQALVPGLVPAGAGAPEDGVTPSPSLLLDVLTSGELIRSATIGSVAPSAVVVIAPGDGQGIADAVVKAASAWEGYVPATEVVVASFDATTLPGVAHEAIESSAERAENARPSIVVPSDKRIAAAQVVMALAEQLSGGTGTYGVTASLDLIAAP